MWATGVRGRNTQRPRYAPAGSPHHGAADLRHGRSETRRLFEIRLRKADVLELYRLIDWLMKLPADLEERFRRQVYEYEEKQNMPYVTSIERNAIEKGQLMTSRENVLDLPGGGPAGDPSASERRR